MSKAPHIVRRLRTALTKLRSDTSALAFVEFALVLPIFVAMMVGGIELSNYVTTKMRVSQLALHGADHIARIGSGSLLAAKQISETQINDVLTGVGLQAGRMNLYTNGRVIISSLEPDPNHSGKYYIHWQRCQGLKTKTSTYGAAGADNLSGMGPTGAQVTAPANGQTIFVEVYYEYQPIINSRAFIINSSNTTLTRMDEIAAMPVRDARDTTQIYNTENATVHNCSTYSAT
ncbi:MAG: TadE/TadG family type IV pilus assembly protein [Sphingomonadales bacterium]